MNTSTLYGRRAEHKALWRTLRWKPSLFFILAFFTSDANSLWNHKREWKPFCLIHLAAADTEHFKNWTDNVSSVDSNILWRTIYTNSRNPFSSCMNGQTQSVGFKCCLLLKSSQMCSYTLHSSKHLTAREKFYVKDDVLLTSRDVLLITKCNGVLFHPKRVKMKPDLKLWLKKRFSHYHQCALDQPCNLPGNRDAQHR